MYGTWVQTRSFLHVDECVEVCETLYLRVNKGLLLPQIGILAIQVEVEPFSHLICDCIRVSSESRRGNLLVVLWAQLHDDRSIEITKLRFQVFLLTWARIRSLGIRRILAIEAPVNFLFTLLRSDLLLVALSAWVASSTISLWIKNRRNWFLVLQLTKCNLNELFDLVNEIYLWRLTFHLL